MHEEVAVEFADVAVVKGQMSLAPKACGAIRIIGRPHDYGLSAEHMQRMAARREAVAWRHTAEAIAAYIDGVEKVSMATLMELLRAGEQTVYSGKASSYFSVNVIMAIMFAIGRTKWQDGEDDWKALAKTGKQMAKFKRLLFYCVLCCSGAQRHMLVNGRTISLLFSWQTACVSRHRGAIS
jgi:hypothetical protein